MAAGRAGVSGVMSRERMAQDDKQGCSALICNEWVTVEGTSQYSAKEI